MLFIKKIILIVDLCVSSYYVDLCISSSDYVIKIFQKYFFFEPHCTYVKMYISGLF